MTADSSPETMEAKDNGISSKLWEVGKITPQKTQFHTPKKYENEINAFLVNKCLQNVLPMVLYNKKCQQMLLRLKRKNIRLKTGFIEKNIRKNK